MSRRRTSSLPANPLAELDHLDDLADDGLTLRQRAFVDAYLGVAAFSPATAAEIAGYSSASRNALRVAGHRLLMNVNVQRAIRARLMCFSLTRDAVLERIASLASASLADMFEVSAGLDGEPEFRVDLAAAARVGALGLIRDYTETEDHEGNITRHVKLHDPFRYLMILARHVGLIGSSRAKAANLANEPAQPRVFSDRELIEYYQEQGWELPDGVAP